jgi:uncharacterized protein YceK
MRVRFVVLIAILLSCLGCGRIAERTIGTVGRSAERRGASVLSRDLERDATSKLTRLQVPRQVFKYTTKSDAERMLAKGFPAGSHFTSGIKAGRPLRASRAAERFGLGYQPRKRLSVTLPIGSSVRFNKVVGGAPGGFGEIRVERPLRPSVIKKSARLVPR